MQQGAGSQVGCGKETGDLAQGSPGRERVSGAGGGSLDTASNSRQCTLFLLSSDLGLCIPTSQTRVGETWMDDLDLTWSVWGLEVSPVGEEETEKAGEKRREKGETGGKKEAGWNWRRGGKESAGGGGGGKDCEV